MTDGILDWEKVMRGLEHCVTECIEHCAGCPYQGGFEDRVCIDQILNDAFSLLKAQMPRIVTTADFENNPNLDDSGHLNVWEEYKDSTRSGWNTINVNDVISFTDIRRYWTARPTDEQRKAVPWEPPKEEDNV